MELILLQDVEKVGRKGQVVRVRDGFARNVLIPRKFAMVCTPANEDFVNDQKKRAEIRLEKEKTQAVEKAEKLSTVKIKIEAQAGEQDKLFGSITAEEIAAALQKKGHAVEKKQIHLKESIRTVGSHVVAVELYPQVKASITIEVVRKA